MERTEFMLATAVLLFGAFCAGLLTHWLINRLSHVSKDDLSELDRLAETLHQAEEARDAALTAQKSTEARLKARITQTEAELRAAMDALSEARHETEELRAWIERNHGRK